VRGPGARILNRAIRVLLPREIPTYLIARAVTLWYYAGAVWRLANGTRPPRCYL
jgi:hypothetical protein